MKGAALVVSMLLIPLWLSGCTEEPKKSSVLSFISDPQSQVGRYLSVKNEPNVAQINPLLAISVFKFSPSVRTVGEAIHQVLANTGYRLSENLSDAVKQTLLKPLPITNRTLGPMDIQTALEVLMGAEVFELDRDPLHRLVNFHLKDGMADALGEPHV
jgi:conjugative transfer region protein (TIGR03748 family)